ncbi:MAG: 16S rRNA (uracil(1498)-N(3))-methyltransferase [Myxococcales bacterium]|nr:16S rRNA (uracil(1498)-N(3))-methyltransferase [Myxococcales bacterium]
MNLLLVMPSEVDAGEVVLRGRRAGHVRAVLRVSPGERIRMGVVCESIGTAEVLHSDTESLVLGNLALTSAGPCPRLRLVIALPRPKALKRLLQTAASFQIGRIDLVNAWRVQKSYWDSPAVEHEALVQELLLGCEQGRHVWLPEIVTHRLFVPFLETLDSDATSSQKLVAHPGSSLWLRDIAPSSDCATIAIGPEGGWIDKELENFAERGFQSISISKAILRSEIALAATLAQWEMLTS